MPPEPDWSDELPGSEAGADEPLVLEGLGSESSGSGARPKAEEGRMGGPTAAPGTGPFAARDGYTNVRVFYGTDRAATESNAPKKIYGTERADRVKLGFCDVSIPGIHEVGELEAPKIWRFEFREDPKKHVVLLDVIPADGPTFLTRLRRTIEESVEVTTIGGERREIGGEAFIFVHGYNVSFEDAARRTAQIAYDLRFRGAPIMYSWPSQGRSSLDAYKADGRTAKWCEENVTDFVAAVARESGARKIHLIAHSMGNRIVAAALRRLAYLRRIDEMPRFNEVILTAPDIDAETFRESIAPRIVQAAERITIYASSNDVALKASSLLNTLEGARLGMGGRYLTVFPEYEQIDVVDASAVDTSLFAFGHSYHADSDSVLADIRLVFGGRPAAQRGLTPLIKDRAWKMLGEPQPGRVQPAGFKR